MKFSRRAFLPLAVGAAALPGLSRVAQAQAWPSRAVRIVVGFPPGGATDIQARLMGEWLTVRLGQQFIVENKPGASGNIGTDTVAKAPADGYTLLQVVTRTRSIRRSTAISPSTSSGTSRRSSTSRGWPTSSW
jgi:tripartite-type tricarboxylate transporter receptor subunit TctC